MENAILVLLPNKPFLGNQITQIPFFEEIKGNKKIITVGTKKSYFVIKNLGYIDLAFEYRKKSFLDLFKIIKKIKKDYNVTEVYNFRYRSIRISFILALFFRNITGYLNKRKNPLSIFYKKKKIFNKKEYIAHNYLKLCDGKLEEYYLENVRRKKSISIIPGGSNDFKKYPLSKYLKVVREFENDYEINFILGNDMLKEQEELKPYKEKYNLVIGEKLDKLRMLLQETSLVISNDCGPSHFAHIYNTPRISLFAGNTNPREWFNKTDKSILLESSNRDNIDSIREEDIIISARKILNR
ncbi:ADP-heptose:LPS heptosyltransferase [Hypnocyclicus thermotrophus]|uniref:ADP-heptose:LPS heptosyltransferase n=1 Tax=Hypnocyclicus thermotrophus TaxID=1627895 RepID=A0AA46I6J7_9FUSO|nr:lipopolysaccharide heptosyltransferase family protein [Hypnocyclicus thermotrophus]TDT72520.1 ADP-heptose:LPS heptosyltransferase [Hypnocyclicus thermotrophus]